MTTITDRTGGPAFPVTDSHHANGQIQYGTSGMTLRDYFAAHAPEPPGDFWRGGERSIKDIIDWRWYYAEAMLKAREV